MSHGRRKTMGSRLLLLVALGSTVWSSFAPGILVTATTASTHTNPVTATAATTATTATTSTNTAKTKTTTLADLKSYPLPRVHLQFICPDVNFLLPRSDAGNFDVVQMFDDYYMIVLPTLLLNNHSNSSSDNSNNHSSSDNNKENKLSRITIARHSQRLSSMKDISPDKWYYPQCNITSPQVLLTLQAEGYALYNKGDDNDDDDDSNSSTTSPSSSNSTEGNPEPSNNKKEYLFHDALMNHVTPESLKSYIESNVCPHMHMYRAVVEDPISVEPSTFDLDYDPFLDHNTILLCGGERYIYHDGTEEGEVDSGFILFGMIVGVFMVSMIGGELQLLFRRSHPSPRGERRGMEPEGVVLADGGATTAAAAASGADHTLRPHHDADATSTASSSSSSPRTRRRTSRRRRDRRRRVDYALAPPSEVEMV